MTNVAMAVASPQLQFRVNANQRAFRWRGRAEIAHKTIFRPNLHVTDASIRSVNQHRTDGRSKWIAHRQFFEAVVGNKIIRRVSC